MLTFFAFFVCYHMDELSLVGLNFLSRRGIPFLLQMEVNNRVYEVNNSFISRKTCCVLRNGISAPA